MKFEQTDLEGVWIITPQKYGDDRGYFMETFKEDLFQEYIGKISFIQDNESKSVLGVLRGLHFQEGEYSQAKLVRVIEGRVLDVAVDLRKSSKTFGKHIAVELSDKNARQLFIPRGFAHGFIVLSESAVFNYKVDNIYMPSAERTLAFDDPTLQIDWYLDADRFLLSDKDKKGCSFEACFKFD
ncbi:MAG: dTDP-4-dehydrorhamnose 3,5-epimerase [Bacteroidales bacterium]